MNPSALRRGLLIALGAFALSASISGCGFHLRGQSPLAFPSVYVGISAFSDLGASVRRQILTSGSTVIEEDPAKAAARLEILGNSQTREILTLSGAGKVREYQLTHAITFRLVNSAGEEIIRPTKISATREYNFDDSQVLAKEQEEALLYRDMQSDLVQQLMRRLAAVKS